ncbi:MAG: MFS transporter [Alphaproteobacteria bacterium]
MTTTDIALAERRLSLTAVLTSAVAAGISIGMTTPLVALVMAAAGHGSLAIGLNAAAQSVTLLAVGPFVPWVINRVGPVPAIVGGLLLSAAALAAFPMVPVLAVWFLLRIALGLGGALDWIVGETWVNSLATGRRRGRVLALYASLWGGGVAVGPLLLNLTGTEGALPFLVGAGLLCLACLPVAAARRLAPAMAEKPSPMGVLAAVGAAPVAMAAGFMSGFGEGTVFALLPVYGLRSGFEPAAAVLLISVFAAGAILIQPLIGWLADRIDRCIHRGGFPIPALSCGRTAAIRYRHHPPA